MKHKRFCTWLMICGLIFAVIASGGCGGSGGGDVQIPNGTNGNNGAERTDGEENIKKEYQAEAVLTDDDVAELYKDVAALVEMFESLDKDGTLAKINARGLHVAEFSANGDVYTDVTPQAVSSDKAVALLSNDLRAAFTRGEVIALLSPKAENVNKLYKALGVSFDVKVGGHAEGLDIFALAMASDDKGQLHTFAYQMPQWDSFTYKNGEGSVISSDVTADVDDVASGDADYTEYPYTGTTSEDVRKIVRDYNVKRLMDFFHWCGNGIDSELAASEAIAALKAAAAADELTALAAAHHKTIPFNYTKTFAPFGDYNSGLYNRTITRETKGIYHVYSCHSFATGSDFYLVQATLSSMPHTQETNPQRNYTDGDPAFYTDYYAGFTDYLINQAYIEGADNDPNKVQLIYNIPGDSVPEKQTVTKSDSWSISTEVGFGGKVTGESAEFSFNAKLSQSASHSNSITYTTQNWRIQNYCGVSNAQFTAFFTKEANGNEQKHYYNIFGDKDYWIKLNLDSASTTRIEFTTEWIWEVKKDFWQNRDRVKLIANPTVGERFAFGAGYCYRPWGSNRGDRNLNNGRAQTIDVTNAADICAPAPAHVYVNQTNFNTNADAQEAAFRLLCNSDWKVESDSDWCKIGSDSTGTDTGAQERFIRFNIDAHPNAGGAYAVRQAVITVTELLPNNRTGSVVKVYVQQSTIR